MSQYNNTAESVKYKHLTVRERYKIEILLKEGLKPFEIARRMGKGTRTIEREKAKGKVRLLNHDLTYREEYPKHAHGEGLYLKNFLLGVVRAFGEISKQ